MTVHCTRTGCERSFKTDHGLTVHLARSHKDADTDHADTSEQQPVEHVEGDELEAASERDGVVYVGEVSGVILLEADEVEVIRAVSFLMGWADDEAVLLAAVNDLLAWARDDPTVQQAMALRASAKEGPDA